MLNKKFKEYVRESIKYINMDQDIQEAQINNLGEYLDQIEQQNEKIMDRLLILEGDGNDRRKKERRKKR